MSVWDELVGQDAAVATLSDAAAAARRRVERASTDAPSAEVGSAADGDRSMTHAWLITGPPGSGRSVAARAFAAALQCTGPTPGCGTCPGCHTTMSGTNGDVAIVSTEASTISIAEAKDIVARAQVAPSQGRWRVIVVEDADRIAERSSNVLLKAVEEPPERTVWILCAPSPEDMIQTIRSRCRHLGLRIPPAEAVARLLVDRDGADPETALAAARAAQSHIGLARALARDPEMRERRRAIITAPVHVRSVGEAVLAAADLLEIADEETRARVSARDAEELARLTQQLGLQEGETLSAHARGQIRQLEADQKRRAKRATLDTLDRALLDILAIYRDVLMVQLGTGQDLVNADLADTVAEIAADSTPTQTMARIEAIEVARRRLQPNASFALVLEAMIIALRPQS